MKWDEFRGLLSGLGPETPLGRIVAIRSEEDKEILEHFTEDQHSIRNEWRRRKAKEVSKEQMDELLEQMKNAFIYLAQGR